MLDDDDAGAPHDGRPMTFFAALLWTGAAWILWSLIVGVTESARPGAVTDLVNVTACAVLAYSALFFLMLRLYAPEGSVRDMFGLRAVAPSGVVLAIAAGVSLAPALDFLDAVLVKRFPRSPEDVEFSEKLLHATSLGERIVLVAALAVAFPACQELLFRGAIFRGLRRAHVEGFAVVASAVLFMIQDTSLDARAMPSAMVLGLLAAWLRGRSGSVVPALCAHIAYAATSATRLAMGKGDADLGPRVAIACAIGTAVLAGTAGALFARDERAEKARSRDA